MNEFTAKKMGEVLAFNQLGTDTLEKGKNALVEALGAEKVKDMEEKHKLHAEAIVSIATESGVIDTTLSKAEKTKEKLSKMRDLYIGDQWDNATELFEWGGFFEGAAIVHWNVVKGAALALDIPTLASLCEEGIEYHYGNLEILEQELTERGSSKATA